MKQRLRNYISVVTALSLCLGLWFGTGQIIKAEGTQQGTLKIRLYGEDESEYKTINNISIDNFTTAGDSYTGTFTLTKEQVKCEDDGKYLLYWYTNNSLDGSSNPIDTGSEADKFIFNLSNLTKENITMEEDGSGTIVTILLYAKKGSKHTAAYQSDNGNQLDPKEFYQDSLNTGEVSYDHPQPPMDWIPAGKQFKYWEATTSGNPKAPDGFTYEDYDSYVTFQTAWEDITSIVSGITYKLASKIQYSLTSGTWIVNDGADGCTYNGDREFYVEEGEYKFTSQ